MASNRTALTFFFPIVSPFPLSRFLPTRAAIYDLKKDNQELEKFKFVLDYQIKELKRQIEPRENEIADMKDAVMKMDANLELFHKENGALKQEVLDLRAKLGVKMQAIRRQRQLYRQSQSELSALQNDLHELVAFIQDPLTLKDAVKKCYQTHVTEKIQAAEVDPDVSKEYKRQKAYLDKSVDVLKKKLSRDLMSRRNDNMRLMQENVALIKEVRHNGNRRRRTHRREDEGAFLTGMVLVLTNVFLCSFVPLLSAPPSLPLQINKLRRELVLMHQVQRQKELNTATLKSFGDSPDQWNEQERQKLSEMQKTQIATLRMQLEEAQTRLVHFRPTSRGNAAQSMEDFAKKAIQQAQRA